MTIGVARRLGAPVHPVMEALHHPPASLRVSSSLSSPTLAMVEGIAPLPDWMDATTGTGL